MCPRTSGDDEYALSEHVPQRDRPTTVMGAATTYGHPVRRFSQQTFLLSRLKVLTAR
jgi:hypothetical protein